MGSSRQIFGELISDQMCVCLSAGRLRSPRCWIGLTIHLLEGVRILNVGSPRGDQSLWFFLTFLRRNRFTDQTNDSVIPWEWYSCHPHLPPVRPLRESKWRPEGCSADRKISQRECEDFAGYLNQAAEAGWVTLPSDQALLSNRPEFPIVWDSILSKRLYVLTLQPCRNPYSLLYLSSPVSSVLEQNPTWNASSKRRLPLHSLRVLTLGPFSDDPLMELSSPWLSAESHGLRTTRRLVILESTFSTWYIYLCGVRVEGVKSCVGKSAEASGSEAVSQERTPAENQWLSPLGHIKRCTPDPQIAPESPLSTSK